MCRQTCYELRYLEWASRRNRAAGWSPVGPCSISARRARSDWKSSRGSSCVSVSWTWRRRTALGSTDTLSCSSFPAYLEKVPAPIYTPTYLSKGLNMIRIFQHGGVIARSSIAFFNYIPNDPLSFSFFPIPTRYIFWPPLFLQDKAPFLSTNQYHYLYISISLYYYCPLSSLLFATISVSCVLRGLKSQSIKWGLSIIHPSVLSWGYMNSWERAVNACRVMAAPCAEKFVWASHVDLPVAIFLRLLPAILL